MIYFLEFTLTKMSICFNTVNFVENQVQLFIELRCDAVNTGVKARQTMSLTNTAESTAPMVINTKRNLSGLPINRVILEAIQV